MKKIVMLLAIAALSGCASDSGVTPMGHGNYMIAKQAATGFSGLGNLKTDSLRDADAFCTKQGKMLEVLDARENEGPFTMGKFPRAEVTFRCVAESIQK